MGFEIKRFQGDGDVDEELICPICSGVLEDPLQVSIVFNLKRLLCNVDIIISKRYNMYAVTGTCL